MEKVYFQRNKAISMLVEKFLCGNKIYSIIYFTTGILKYSSRTKAATPKATE
jgi:hypothetical protein